MANSEVIYLIDDDPSARKGLSRLLSVAGHEVKEFLSGDEFLAVAKPDMTGCIILGARMPGLSIEELHSELILRHISLLLIFVTADCDPKIKEIAMQVNAVGFFRKPVDGTALLDAIDWALSNERA